jgi:hypothetical protein
MAEPQHDPELFDELMRAERDAAARSGKRRKRGRAVVVCGLVVLAGVLSYRAATRTAPGEQPPAGEAHGLDVTAGQCFWSPTGTGEVDVLLTSCTAPHTAEAFAVLPLAAGWVADIGDSYQQTLHRCTAAASPVPGARVQIMTPVIERSDQRAVCCYRFAQEMTAPVR